MDHKTLSDLIGMIYDTAFNIELWPRLTQMLADELTPVLADSPKSISILQRFDPTDCVSGLIPAQDRAGTEFINAQGRTTSPRNNRSDKLSNVELVDLLHSHFTRALALNHQIFETQRESNALLSLFDRLPLGMLVVDRDGYVLTHNRKLDQILSEEKGIAIHQKRINADSSTDTRRLRQAIRAVADNDHQQGETVHLCSPDSVVPISALILPYDADNSASYNDGDKVVVILTTPGMHIEVSTDTLISVYKLTKAEARLVSSLVKGSSLNSIAENFGLSKHTVRNQLKSVYEKTGTHRQAELVRQVITGPAMLATICNQENSPSRFGNSSGRPVFAIRSESRHHQATQLPDGRMLGYAEYGIEDGAPVMLMHASGSSRLERHPDETIAERLGVRLIVPDRPGGGLSDINSKLTLLNWTRDVSFLADHLKIDTFSIIGNSLGAPFALACASRLEKRVKRLVIVAGIAPFSHIKELEGMYAPNRLMFFLARYARILIEPILKFTLQKITLEAYRKDQWKNLPPVDKALVYDSTIKDLIMESTMENLRRNNHNMFDEIFLAASPWGFDLSDINVPVELWQGELDRIVPPLMARKMASELPNCRLHYLPGAGHYLIFHCWKEILLSAICEEF